MSIHVVLCDSDPSVARLISCRLMRADLDVHTIQDCENVWDVIHRLQPQLVIADLQFPGIELLCKLRNTQETANLPVIALSDQTAAPVVMDEICRDLHLTAVLPKPFSMRKLVRLALDATHAPSLEMATV